MLSSEAETTQTLLPDVVYSSWIPTPDVWIMLQPPLSWLLMMALDGFNTACDLWLSRRKRISQVTSLANDFPSASSASYII